MVNVSIIGLGFVGESMKKSFELKRTFVIGYDKYKNGTDSFKDCLKGDIVFLALPTIFDEDKMSYDISCIHEVCTDLANSEYKGLVVIKSTVEPMTTEGLIETYPTLKFIHNPEFLTTATAFEDFHNQKHIVLGKGSNISDNDVDILEHFYRSHYPDAEISRCSCTESESMKIFVNSFYSVKIQFFNELYLLCDKMGCDYNIIKELMLKNKWINPMHTNVPGADGKLSYGGHCFPKDTNALLNHMKRNGSHCKVLEATITERNIMRDDHMNMKLKKNNNLICNFITEHMDENIGKTKRPAVFIANNEDDSRFFQSEL